MGRPLGSKNKPKNTNYQVRYIPLHVTASLAGKKPTIFTVNNYLITTQEGKNVLATHLLFGGVPTPKLHSILTVAGFKLRRVSLEYTSTKLNKTFKLTDSDNGCYAAYYNETGELTEPQIEVITKILGTCARAGQAGKTFLCPSWALVDKIWEDRKNWLDIVAAPVTPPPPAATPATEEDDSLVMLDDEGDN
jgi:hypothetical protein